MCVRLFFPREMEAAARAIADSIIVIVLGFPRPVIFFMVFVNEERPTSICPETGAIRQIPTRERKNNGIDMKQKV